MDMKQFTYRDVHTSKKVCIAFSTIKLRYRQDCKQRRFSRLWAVLPLCYVKICKTTPQEWALGAVDPGNFSAMSKRPKYLLSSFSSNFPAWKTQQNQHTSLMGVHDHFLGMHMSNVWIRKNISKLSCRRWCRSWTWDLRRRGRRSLCWLGTSGAQRVWTVILHAMFCWKDYVHSIWEHMGTSYLWYLEYKHQKIQRVENILLWALSALPCLTASENSTMVPACGSTSSL